MNADELSWGYLFQLALLQACNVQGYVTGTGDKLGEGIPGATPFSFIEPDLYSDPYSYAALSLVEYNRTALLNVDTLTSITQQVFSTFFEWFASSHSGYTGEYWAYQPLEAQLPSDLDFGPTESFVITTETTSWAETLCQSSMSTYSKPYTEDGKEFLKTLSAIRCVKPTLTSYSYQTKTYSYWTIEDTRTPSSSSPPASRTHSARSASATSADRTVTPAAQLHRRADPTTLPPTNPRIIRAKVSVRTDTLVISPSALFLSISILIFLIISTLVIYIAQTHQLRLLPRDFDSPASILAAVYASEKLKAWAKRQHERRKLADDAGLRGKERDLLVEDDVKVGMGWFRGADGKEHWGIEVMEEYPLLADKDEGGNEGDSLVEDRRD